VSTLLGCRVLDATFQLLSRTECHHSARGDRNIFPRLRVTARTLVFVTQIKITKSGQFYLFSVFQRAANLFKKKFYQLFGIAFAQPEFFKQVL